MRIRAISIEGEADATTIAAIRAVLENAPGVVHLLATAGSPPRPSVTGIIKRVSFETGVSESTIVGPFRGKGAVRARTMVMWAARELLGAPLSLIGDRLGDRDHKTVSTGVARGRRLIASDPAFRLLAAKMREHVDAATPGAGS